MTIAELIELLQDLPGEAEVRLAYQPSYPMYAPLGAVVAVSPNDGEIAELEEALQGDLTDQEAMEVNERISDLSVENEVGVVYLGQAGGSNDYLPGDACIALGWR